LSDSVTGKDNLTYGEFLQQLKLANSGLDINQINVVKTGTSNIYSGGFGTNFTESLTNF
jgi:hypothetical protein